MRARMRQEDQEKILTELRSRVLHALSDQATAGKIRLDEMLADSVYHEQRRLKEERDSRSRKEDTAFWRKVRTEMQRANDKTLLNLLGQAVDRYGSEIAGYFDMRNHAGDRAEAVGAPVNTQIVSPEIE